MEPLAGAENVSLDCPKERDSCKMGRMQQHLRVDSTIYLSQDDWGGIILGAGY